LYNDIGEVDDDDGGSVDSSDKERTELVLVLLSNLYSKLESILVGVNKPSSCSTSHHCYKTRVWTDFG